MTLDEHGEVSGAGVLLNQAGISLGDPVTSESLKRIELAAQAMDVHFRVDYRKADDGVVLMLLAK